MQHGKKKFKLSRTASHRDALLANMAASLFLHTKITTTTTKAKALREVVDRLISTAKLDTLHSKRLIAAKMTDKAALKKLFQDIVPKLGDRTSGYVRVVKAGYRKGDRAERSVVELLIEKPEEVVEKKEGRLQKISNRLKRSKTGSGKAKAQTAPKKTAKAGKGGKT